MIIVVLCIDRIASPVDLLSSFISLKKAATLAWDMVERALDEFSSSCPRSPMKGDPC
jgi:hypothetical protein